jgi:hypothetical protein
VHFVTIINTFSPRRGRNGRVVIQGEVPFGDAVVSILDTRTGTGATASVRLAELDADRDMKAKLIGLAVLSALETDPHMAVAQ